MSDRTKGILGLLLCVVLIVGGIQSCTHEHDWQDATCTEPRTCSSCKATDGEPLGHKLGDATCLSPATCSVCGTKQGFRAKHTFVSATCTEPEHCSVCGKKAHWYSLSLGHKWEDATCAVPKTCSVCGETDGEPTNHYSIQHITTVKPTCQTDGEKTFTCYYCGEVFTETVPVVDHKTGDWQVEVEATPTSDGIWKRYCVMCGLEMDSMSRKYIDLSGNGTGAGGSYFNTYDNKDQQNTTAAYVLNTSTKIFHRPSCRDVPKISPSNYATSNQSRSDLISSGYSVCGHCSP